MTKRQERTLLQSATGFPQAEAVALSECAQSGSVTDCSRKGGLSSVSRKTAR